MNEETAIFHMVRMVSLVDRLKRDMESITTEADRWRVWLEMRELKIKRLAREEPAE